MGVGGGAWGNLTHLIIVAGHTVFTGRDLDVDRVDSADWSLEKFQQTQLGAFVGHIREGVRMAAADPSAMLLFSGGATRRHAGPRTEGFSYWQYADAQGWFGDLPGGPERNGGWGGGARDRVHTEEFARDSFENVLFSVCRFRQIANRYPERITVVSLPFKKPRFETLHREAIRYPKGRFGFVGVGNSTREAEEGEKRNAWNLFKGDPMGCSGDLLRKKQMRNPFSASAPYPSGCEELRGLFSHCAGHLYRGPLPWDGLD